MAFEKSYPAIGPATFTEAGTVGGLVTLDSTQGFKVKMPVVLSSGGTDRVDLEVKRVFDETRLILGPRGTRLDCFSDLSSYPIGSILSVLGRRDLKRPDIPLNEISRWVYEEEPTVALRVVNVDEYGRKISSIIDDQGNVRLTVDAQITIVGDIKRFKQSLTTTPGTEQTLISEVVPAGKKWNVVTGVALARMSGRWRILVDGNLEWSGFTGPGGDNRPAVFVSRALEATEGKVVEIKFLARPGSAVGAYVDAYLHVAEN